MVIRLDIEIWAIGKGALKKVGGRDMWGYWVLWPFCMFGCISVVAEGACVRDYRG
jgi:hypothetical protein